MDPRLSVSQKSLMALLPCTMFLISQMKLAVQCLGKTLKENQPFSALAEVDLQLFHMTMSKLMMVRDILLLAALEVLDILNFLLKEKLLPIPLLWLIASRYCEGNNMRV